MQTNHRTHRYNSFGLCVPSLLMALLSAAIACPASSAPSDVLLAVNENEGTISLIEPQHGTVLAKIPEGGFAGHEVASSPDGKFAYVPIYGDSNAGVAGTDGRDIVKIDLESRKVVGKFEFDHGLRPHDIVYNAHDGLLYVSTELDRRVSMIDPGTMKLVGAIPTGQALSHMFVISHDGRFAYVSNIEPGSVSVLDLRARKLLGVIPVSAKAQRIAISTDDRWVFTADQTKPRLAVIDAATRSIKNWIPLPAPGMGLTPTSDGRWLMVAIESTSQVAVVDLNSMKVVRTIDLPRYPHEIVINPNGAFAYVSCSVTGDVVSLHIPDWKVAWRTHSGPFVDGLAWSSAK